MTMYYVKIPLRFLAPAEQRAGGQQSFEDACKAVLGELRIYQVPTWAVSCDDLEQVRIEDDGVSDPEAAGGKDGR